MLSLAIIVKDEHEALDRCLGSVDGHVDEIVVVANDPASKELKEVVIKYNGKLFERKWNNNFADARNFSFDKCTGDVIFWLDADDTVVNPEKLKKLATDIMAGKYDWVTMQYDYEFDELGRCIMKHWKPRLTRRDTGKWVAAIHENFLPHKAVNQVRDLDVRIVHHQDADHREQSGKRNLQILEEEFNRDGENTDPRTLYYLANTLMGMGDFDSAIPFYMMHVKKCGWVEEKYFSMHYLSKCLIWTDRIDEAINTSLAATKLIPDWSLAYYDVAEAYMAKKDYKKEISWILTGTTKDKPDPSVYFINDLDYDLYPYARLADAYLEIHNFDEAYKIAENLSKKYPKDENVQGLLKDAKECKRGNDFVKSFINVAGYIRGKDRVKAVKLFDCLPIEADDDVRIQEARKVIVPPKVWEDNTIAIFCPPGYDEWAYPSLFSGIGGSEEMVIRLSAELQKMGYKVTVYCKCGSLAGVYGGVEYKPYHHFNHLDQFDTVIIWRYPGFLNEKLNAKHALVWLHDIVHDSMFNENIIANTDKFLFLSEWHRNNAPQIPDEKVFITRNAVDPKEFLEIPEKKPNSLVWTSSYDRGLVCLGRDILPLIQKEIPDVTLDVAYGTGNLEKDMENHPHLKEIFDNVQEIFKKPNVRHHGRISHSKVAELQKNSLIHAYSSEFGETFNISSIKAQLAGAYVITTSQAGATPEYVRFGKVLQGDNIYTDKSLQKQYADEVIKFLKNPVKITDEQRQAIADEFSVEKLAREWDKNVLNKIGQG